MTAPEPYDDSEFDYGQGIPGIDEAVRRRAATLKPLTVAQRATINALFNRPQS